MIGLLLATRNAHKVVEIRDILCKEARCLDLSAFPDAPDVVEDAATFEANATKKAVALARWLAARDTGDSLDAHHVSRFTHHASLITHVLADDSGLEVDALHGAPGVHSARFAALDSGVPGNSSSAENNAKLLRLLQGVPMEKRTARFRCVLALTPVAASQRESASQVCYADEFEMATELFEGACEGRIGFELKGQGGFGYDPLFFPAGYDQTFGELPEGVKNHLSHRAKALEKLRDRLFGSNDYRSAQS